MPSAPTGSWGLVVLRPMPGRQRNLRLAAMAALVLLVSGCSLVSASMVAEALFQVSATRPKLLDDGATQFDAREYEILQKSQVELLKSWFVLNAAVRDPGIATLPILAGQSDPVAWLEEHLKVEFLDGSEILSIRLHGTDSEADDLKRLVDAVARAYEKEVVYNEKQRRYIERDAKAKTLDSMGKELSDNLEEWEALKAELKEQSDSSSVLQFKRIQLDVLTDVYRQLLLSLKLDDIEIYAPPRIRQIQPAVVTEE